jgi:antitoxin component of MazEF toxin-antitoxin module
MNTSANSDDYILPADSLRAYQLAVYFENEWLWKEKDPVCRANAARRLAELTAKLAELEAEEAQNSVEQTVANDVA